jgi:hypothetical protein
MGNWEEAVASIRSGDRFGKLVVLGYDAVKGGALRLRVRLRQADVHGWPESSYGLGD